MAGRFDITVIGRRTAPGDALVAAKVHHKLLTLQARQGVHTRGLARAAAQKICCARISY